MRRLQGVALLLGFSVVALLVYEPSLDGAFVSDDAIYVADNPFVQHPSAERLAEVLKPWGVVPVMVRNYAPVHLLLHSLEWQLFGARVRGYHVVNVLIHAAAATLLAVLWVQVGLERRLALLGAALFAVHPANVEAVAWISQLKSVGALALALGALVLLPRRPAWATLLFVAALLTKASAAVALPFAALLWTLTPREASPRSSGRWLALWTLLFGLYAIAQLAAYATDAPAALPDAGLRVRVQSSLVIGLRYLVMSATGLGLSTFHEPAPVRSGLEPLLWVAVVAWALLGWRTLACLRARRVEAAWWLWALLSFLPVAQISPFRYPMADRYLYFILPGLIGATLFALRDLRLVVGDGRGAALCRSAGVIAAGGLIVLFAARAHTRAAIWKTPGRVVVDAALHYPAGTQATLMRAKSRAAAGDVESTVSLLRQLMQRAGWDRFDQLQADPAYRRVRDDPRFRALVSEMAGRWISHFESRSPSPLELRVIAAAHEARGDYEAAQAALGRAIREGGSFEAQIRRELAELRERAASARSSGS